MSTKPLRIALVPVWTFWQGTTHGGAVVDGIEGLDFCNFHTLSAPNNDDYVGAFADNPNQLQLRVSITAERVVPTLSSGGITEYALTVGGGNGPWELDTYAELQLGFGTGDNFVQASSLTADLRFDTADATSPQIPDFYLEPVDFFTDPILEFLAHRGDALLFRGSSRSGDVIAIVFSSSNMLNVPLDVPDLPVAVRDFYTTDELADLEPSEVPFTIRFVPMWPNLLPLLYADFNRDFDVDGDDFLMWQQGFGIYDGATKVDGDADEDGDVDGDDFLFWQDQFGTVFPPFYGYGAAAAPEPASIALLLLAVVGTVFPMQRQLDHRPKKQWSVTSSGENPSPEAF